jgi:hypothetical protein
MQIVIMRFTRFHTPVHTMAVMLFSSFPYSMTQQGVSEEEKQIKNLAL